MQKLLVWTRRLILASIIISLGAYVLFFTLNNTQHVSVDFLFAAWPEAPIELVIVSSFIVGGLCGLLCTCGLWLRSRALLNKTQLELNKLKR